MPSYDFRCRECGASITHHFKTIHAYSTATPSCPHCQSTALTRIINGVNLPKQTNQHHFANLSSQEMLGVLESGDQHAVKEMVKQVQQTTQE
ncbi:MAG: FmdB family zinc ribbon protein [Phototrophicaceae bacterium]